MNTYASLPKQLLTMLIMMVICLALLVACDIEEDEANNGNALLEENRKERRELENQPDSVPFLPGDKTPADAI